jgi:hypothetical protein
MSPWYDEVKSKYLSTKQGTEVILTNITEINRVTDKPDYQPKNKDNETQGFCFEFVGEEGIVCATTYALQKALADANVEIGDTITIKHPEHSKYEVVKA